MRGSFFGALMTFLLVVGAEFLDPAGRPLSFFTAEGVLDLVLWLPNLSVLLAMPIGPAFLDFLTRGMIDSVICCNSMIDYTTDCRYLVRDRKEKRC